ncbi:unnamed protein product [Laminaria digitata]
MIMASLDDDVDDKPERGLLELVGLAESRGYKQAAEHTHPYPPVPPALFRVEQKQASTTGAAAGSKSETALRTELEERVESLERDLARAGQESRAQSEKEESLQRQLDAGWGGRGGGAERGGRGGKGGMRASTGMGKEG